VAQDDGLPLPRGEPPQRVVQIAALEPVEGDLLGAAGVRQVVHRKRAATFERRSRERDRLTTV
jgi:hypothetical protein